MGIDNYWHPVTEPHPDGKSEGVEIMDVSGRIYQAPGEVILDGIIMGEPCRPDVKAFAWRAI